MSATALVPPQTPPLSCARRYTCTFRPAAVKHPGTRVEDLLLQTANRPLQDPVTRSVLCLPNQTKNMSTHTPGTQVFHSTIPSPLPRIGVPRTIGKLSPTCPCSPRPPLPSRQHLSAEILSSSAVSSACPLPPCAPARSRNAKYACSHPTARAAPPAHVLPALPAKTRPHVPKRCCVIHLLARMEIPPTLHPAAVRTRALSLPVYLRLNDNDAIIYLSSTEEKQ